MYRRIVIAGFALALVTGCSSGGSGGASSAQSASAPAGSFACDDAAFESDRSGLARGALSGDQFVDICGNVTRVLRERHTRSGNHGYFYVRLKTGDSIEIVANLDAMAEAPNDAPPPAWPWVAPGETVYVQGRYYYDSPTRQGIDWTEDDTSRSWPHVGYVAVCDSGGVSCTRYW